MNYTIRYMSAPNDDQENAKARRIQMVLYVLTGAMILLPLLIFWLVGIKT